MSHVYSVLQKYLFSDHIEKNQAKAVAQAVRSLLA